MLPGARRIRHRNEFRAVLGGSRAGAATMVVSVGPLGEDGRPARVGFIVGRSVGGSVVRHRVVRRLRHVAAGVLDQVPVGWGAVVRALPPAADATSAQLRADLEGCLRRISARSARGPRPVGVTR